MYVYLTSPSTSQYLGNIIVNSSSADKSQKILFLIGLTLIIGLQKTVSFFSRRQKLKGTAAFAIGILLILLRWPIPGFLIELYGIFILFGDFLITIGQVAGNIPIIGPYIKQVLETLAGGRRNVELPV
jgi:vesicle transport protein GOT1